MPHAHTEGTLRKRFHDGVLPVAGYLTQALICGDGVLAHADRVVEAAGSVGRDHGDVTRWEEITFDQERGAVTSEHGHAVEFGRGRLSDDVVTGEVPRVNALIPARD
jgi:hypothetical protein